MEEISVKGEDYIKASVIAKKFGYTADYIGQLCRTDQIKATLVGRSWYVNEKSLLEHKRGRYRSNLTKSKEAIQKNVTQTKKQSHSFDSRYLTRLVSYDSDENDLLPVVPVKEIMHKSSENTKNTAENITILTSEPAPTTTQSESQVAPQPMGNRRSTAVLRTIPALRPIQQAVKSPLKRTEVIRKRSGLSVALLVAVVLIGETLMMSAFIGMEKKLVTTTDGSEVVLYKFNLTEISNSASAILAQIR